MGEGNHKFAVCMNEATPNECSFPFSVMSYLSVCIENDEYVLLSLLLFLSKYSILSCPATRKTFEISDLSIYNQGVKSAFRSCTLLSFLKSLKP